MNATDIIGFTADADIWCPDCAVSAYGAEIMTGDVPDSEGNNVRPIFVDDACDFDHCGKCDCDAFVRASWPDLRNLDPMQCGHDFALTRNHHGAGFWDRGLGELGDRLTADAHAYGSSDGYFTTDETEVHLS